jgi:hypothetical protein
LDNFVDGFFCNFNQRASPERNLDGFDLGPGYGRVAGMEGATVTAASDATGVKLTAKTNGTGFYSCNPPL